MLEKNYKGENMEKMTFYLVLMLVLLILIIWFVKISNKFNRYQVIIEESKKNVDIYLGKRYDTICEMIKVTKSFARHEKGVFSDVMKSRANSSIEGFNKTMYSQDKTIKKIFALAEAYPELKSSEEFLNLQEQIDEENEELAAAKRIVNSNISKLNQDIVSFPNSIIAGMKGLKKANFLYEEDIERKRSISDFDYEVK